MKQRRMKKLQEQGGVASGEVVGDSKEEGAAEDLADFNFDTTENKQGDAVKDGGGGVASEVSALLAVELKRAQEKAERDDEEKKERIRTSHVRPWDKGKGIILYSLTYTKFFIGLERRTFKVTFINEYSFYRILILSNFSGFIVITKFSTG